MYRKNVVVVEYVILIFFVSVLVSDKIEIFPFHNEDVMGLRAMLCNFFRF
jgi:hypothetical protein